MLAQKHALANYFLVWILFGHSFIALAENAEAEKSEPNEEFDRELRDMGFSRILRGGNSGFTRILRSPGAGFSRILRDPVGFSRILRDQSFSRILRSDPDYNNELDEEKRSPSSFTRILRGGGPGDLNSFSRILRGSFSRILKRDAGNSGFTRILRSPGAGFSRILRSPTSFSRILRGDMGFSRILRDPHDLPESVRVRIPEEIEERQNRAQGFSRILRNANEEDSDDDTSYPTRSLRASGFSRIL